MKKPANILLLIVSLLLVAAVITDRMYVSKLKQEFLTLEQQRIETTNKLNTARIVYEKLNHVRDLVFKNMDFPNQQDTISHESHFFDFLTTCINDLKLELVSVKPSKPVVKGRITTYAYELVIEGDFFSFGELCSKFENSRRITTIKTYDVNLVDKSEKRSGGPENRKISVTMTVETYRVEKYVEVPVQTLPQS